MILVADLCMCSTAAVPKLAPCILDASTRLRAEPAKASSFREHLTPTYQDLSVLRVADGVPGERTLTEDRMCVTSV